MLKGFSFGEMSGKVVLSAIVLLTGSGFASASDDVLQRIQPAGWVCIEGQECKAPVAKVAMAKPAMEESEAAPVEAMAKEAAPMADAKVMVASGEETYNKSCAMCHAGGTAGAPKLGDAAAWATRSEKGLDGMLEVAKKGVNAMPPMGMCMTCSDDDLKAAISYMAESGK